MEEVLQFVTVDIFVEVAADMKLVAQVKPFFDLFAEVVVEGLFRFSILLCFIEASGLLRIDALFSLLVDAWLVDADSSEVDPSSASESGPAPASEPGWVSARSC